VAAAEAKAAKADSIAAVRGRKKTLKKAEKATLFVAGAAANAARKLKTPAARAVLKQAVKRGGIAAVGVATRLLRIGAVPALALKIASMQKADQKRAVEKYRKSIGAEEA
jgi:hypothetical protein